MPGKKHITEEQKNFPMISNDPSSKRLASQLNGTGHIDDNAITKDKVKIRKPGNVWLTWVYGKLEGWERKCVEAYVMGWLACTEGLVAGGNMKHDIFFDWEDDDNNNKTVLDVYIDPKDL